ncbi:shikimate dehydrogenase [Rhodospirillaceae bacterium SYSU D60014]|uniref:shikimate dehydrogenase n=1 Tax=Virgifigura deserti TaxID=2268457 RepID=UPI000E670ACD
MTESDAIDATVLSGRAMLAGVVGWPVSHSRSPRLHGFWLRHHRIDGAYLPLPVRPDSLAAALRALPLLGFKGANVTVPHKEAALAIVDRASAAARRIGALNTIVVGADGTLEGQNTDGFGFRENLRAHQPDWTPTAGPAVLLGAGGAARAIAVALLEEGVSEIRLVNRTADRAERLAREINGPFQIHRWADRGAALAEAGLLVNTTTLGMTGQPPLDLDLAALPTDAVVNDIVYAPLETPLLAAARARGNPVVDGVGMLLHQARPGFAAWYGVEPEVTPALRAFVLRDL